MAFDTEFERDILAFASKDVAFREKAKRVLGDHGMTDGHHDWVWGLLKTLPRSDVLGSHNRSA